MKTLVQKAGSFVGGTAVVGGIVGLVLVLCVAGPWLLFWSVGVLTGHAVPLTLKTWLAGIVFLCLVRGGGRSS